MNSAPLSLLGLILAFGSTATGRAGDWLLGEETTSAALVAELATDTRTPATPPGQESAASRPIRRAPDGMFYVEALVNGATVRFLVDTGASHTVLTARDAARAGVRAGHARAVVTAGGPVRFGWATLDRMSLAGHEVTGASAAVSNDRLPVSLLGQDMLSRFRALTIAGDSLWLA